FEADLEPMTGRLGEARERAGGRPAAPALEPGNRALGRLHAPRQLGLAQPGAPSRRGYRRRERKLLFEQVVFPAVVRLFQPRLVKVLDSRHGTFLARWRAISSSRAGVFCVFLTKTRKITTRCPTAVT